MVCSVSALCGVYMGGIYVRIMKKILSKLCMFGLATTVSFGFGSFLAQAVAPTAADDGYDVFGGNSAVINMPAGSLYVKNVVGKDLTWDGSLQALINLEGNMNQPSILFHKTSSNGIVNDVDVSSDASAAAGFGNVWLRGRDKTISGVDSGWVKVWSNGGFLNSEGEGLENVKAAASGEYKFYYYVDSDIFAKNGYGSGTNYTATPGQAVNSSNIPTAAP